MSKPLHLFEAFGIELEYIIVDRESYDVLPISDELIRAASGEIAAEIERGDIAWSNELVLHVIELKTNGPAPQLAGLAASFQREVEAMDALLAPLGGRLMPTAMHPWMDPEREMKLWPHEYSEVYAVFDKIFDCRGHGWSNLQSTHINLPYQGDAELERLHAAIRLVLPLLPALAASSPVVERRRTALLDNRLDVYRHNCRSIPSVTGRVIPETIVSEADYRAKVLAPIARDTASYDPEGVLDPEWVNARGAIVRFVRDSIEIRLLDVQEQPAADLAIAALTVATLQSLVAERHCDLAEQHTHTIEQLEQLLLRTIRDGDEARLDDPRYLSCFGVDASSLSAGELWRRLVEEHQDVLTEHRAALDVILDQGPLARRIVVALERPGATLEAVYARLADCLRHGRMFLPT